MKTFMLCALATFSLSGSPFTDCTEENSSDFLKETIKLFGDDFMTIQDYLNHYYGKGILQDEAFSGAATLKHLFLNGQSRAVIAKRGETIEGTVFCHINPEECQYLKLYRVVLGLKGEGPQVTIANELGLAAGESHEKFTLRAPEKPGVYEIRFKFVQSFFEEPAFKAWREEEPDASTTIGLIVVK